MNTSTPDAPDRSGGSPPPDAPPPVHTRPPEDAGPRVTAAEMRDLGRLRRSVGDRKVAGVAAGLARHLDVDPMIVRVAFVVLAFFGGSGLLAYVAMWVLVPEEGSERVPLGLDERGRTVALVAVAVMAALAAIGDTADSWWYPAFWPLALVALVVAAVLMRREAGDRPGGPPQTSAGPVPGVPGAVGPMVPATGGPLPADGPPPGSPPDDAARYAPEMALPYGVGDYPPYPPGGRPEQPPAAAGRRRRGPVLFWPVLAVTVLALAGLGVVDASGAAVPGSAYPALVVAITGAGLVVGAFLGRAGGLIALGLVAALLTAGGVAAERLGGDRVALKPTTSAAVPASYHHPAGELVLDLGGVTDPEALDGRLLQVTGEVGRIEVVLPGEVAAEVTASVDGPGRVDIAGTTDEGIENRVATRLEGDPVPEAHLVLDVRLEVGEVVVRYE